MSEGVIVGGWAYVIAAYAVTGTGLVAYIWSLRRRYSQLDNED